MSEPIVIYCKSYRTDLKRVTRLTDSINRFNVDNIPFFISVPKCDIEIFKKYLGKFSPHIIQDELIIRNNSKIDVQLFNKLPGNLSQQIVKSEFWRLDISDTYLCIDSDAVFIRPFFKSDFLHAESLPYTVMDESHEFLEAALHTGKFDVLTNFHSEAEHVQKIFGRSGRSFAFGPFPNIWHKSVWKSLDEEHLIPREMNFMDAIVSMPMESRWYGEALLKYHAIQLLPCQPFFKVYHYAWQLDRDRRSGINERKLAMMYNGVIYQSAWERDMDWPKETGSFSSKIARRLRRKLGRI